MESSRKASSRSKPMSILRSLEEKYVVAMKKLQFGEFSLLGNSVRYLHVVYLFADFSHGGCVHHFWLSHECPLDN